MTGAGRKRFISLLFAVLCLFAALPGASAVDETDDTERVLTIFYELAAIPRTSGHEQAVGDYLVSWASQQGFSPERDKTGNVLFDVPATSGYEKAPRTVLQGHMDMVAVSDDPAFDPLTDPIKPVRSGDALRGDGTSLGADNGIGLSVILAFVSSDAPHGPLRVIVTVNEETTLSGVKGLDPACVADAKFLINLDNEAEGSACVSTAAGAILRVAGKAQQTAPALDTALTVKLSGLLGGHSGISINAGRINAIVTLAEMLSALDQAGLSYALASFSGGGVDNAIPTEAEAVIVVKKADAKSVADLIESTAKELKKAYATSDAGLLAAVTAAALPDKVFTAECKKRIVNFAALVPNGVNTMSQRVSGLVESSSNLGTAAATADGIEFSIFVRSSEQSLLDSILLRQRALSNLCDFDCAIEESSDAWPVNVNAKLPGLISDIYKEQTGKDMAVESVHAGLECGTFARMNESIDMVCIGADIASAHTTKETLRISSVGTLYRLLAETLKRLK